MEAIKVIDTNQLPWDERYRDKPARQKHIGDARLQIWAAVAEYDPNHTVAPHSHAQHELLYILDGEITIGGKRYLPGTAVLVEGSTTYGPLTSGDRGVRFLIVRSFEPAGSGA